MLASLVTPCDGKYAAALEVVAGGRLYQVVVDDEKTGKALLERGQLRRRVTLIPLNKVRAGRLDDKRCARASSVAKKAGGSARIALEFVGHEEHVKNAVEYAFGGAPCEHGRRLRRPVLVSISRCRGWSHFRF